MAQALERFVELLVLWGGALVGLVIGFFYFVNAGREARLGARVATSAFGPSLALLFVAAGPLWPEQYRFKALGIHIFYSLQLLPLGLLALTAYSYPGPRRLHAVLIPMGLLAWAWTFALGWLFVHGE